MNVQTPEPMPEANPTALQKVLDNIDIHIRARYPMLYIVTHEESRVETALAKLAQTQNKEVHVWTASSGLTRIDGKTPPPATQQNRLTDPVDLLNDLKTRKGAGIFILKDFHPYLNDPLIVRHARDVAHHMKGSYNTVVMVCPSVNLPRELEKDVTLIDFPLPDAAELMELLRALCQTVSKTGHFKIELSEADGWQLVRAAQGMTLSEAENAFAKAVVTDSKISINDVKRVLDEKQQIVRKSGMLDYHATDFQMSVIGGLENLKNWLAIRARGFTPQAAKFGLPQPKGVLLLGAPGCGKSLTAKAVASAWNMPLLQLDFGKVFSGLVGSSEENMRQALRVADGVAPAVLWIDELEKGLSGNGSGQSDGGTTARVFGTFLTWMQEKASPVFVVATANRIDALPPELLRRGRFDEIFFVDLPGPKARAEIISIHLKKRSRNPDTFDISAVVRETDGFSGAELEHIIAEGLFVAYAQNRDVTTADIVQATKQTVPLSITYKEDLNRLRAWARVRARPADAPEDGDAQDEKGLHIEARSSGKKVV
jgi:SpoVK/Ycf46/Vps4 family AAA+-type ATPase